MGMALQFLAAGFGTMAFSVLFSVPRVSIIPVRLHWRCRLVYLLGMINIFHTGAVEANFAATVFITLADLGESGSLYSKEMSGNSVSHCRNLS